MLLECESDSRHHQTYRLVGPVVRTLTPQGEWQTYSMTVRFGGTTVVTAPGLLRDAGSNPALAISFVLSLCGSRCG